MDSRNIGSTIDYYLDSNADSDILYETFYDDDVEENKDSTSQNGDESTSRIGKIKIKSDLGRYTQLLIRSYEKSRFEDLKKYLTHDEIIWKFLVDGRYHYRNEPLIFDYDRVEDRVIHEGEKNWLMNAKAGFNFALDSLTKFGDMSRSPNCVKLFTDFYEELHKKILPASQYNSECWIGIGKHNGNYEGLLEFFIKSRNSLLHKEWDKRLAPYISYGKYIQKNIVFELNNSSYVISICKNGNDKFHLTGSAEHGYGCVTDYLPGALIESADKKILLKLGIDFGSFKLGYDFTDYRKAYNILTENFNHANVELIKPLGEGLLEEYKERLEPVVCSKEEAIIADIVNLCQDLDIAHFFGDGNTRTAYVFLNMMLLYYGFVPTILDNPNRLEVTDIKTLVRDVIKGQRRTLELLESNVKMSSSQATL